LPPKRRPWQSEDYRMTIFDAAAVGIAYFAEKAWGGRAERESVGPHTGGCRRTVSPGKKKKTFDVVKFR